MEKIKLGELYRKSLGALFAYVSHKIPEISDELLQSRRCDESWFRLGKMDLSEIWDAVGIQKGIELATEAGFTVSDWVKSVESFYKVNEEGQSIFFDKNSGNYNNIPGQEAFIILG